MVSQFSHINLLTISYTLHMISLPSSPSDFIYSTLSLFFMVQAHQPSSCSWNMPPSFLSGPCACSSHDFKVSSPDVHLTGSFTSFRLQVKYHLLKGNLPDQLNHYLLHYPTLFSWQHLVSSLVFIVLFVSFAPLQIQVPQRQWLCLDHQWVPGVYNSGHSNTSISWMALNLSWQSELYRRIFKNTNS